MVSKNNLKIGFASKVRQSKLHQLGLPTRMNLGKNQMAEKLKKKTI